MQLIKSFGEIGKNDASIAGGKGASLGEMTQATVPVPPGFVVLSNAFERFLEETDLNVEIDATIDTVNVHEMHTVENASEKIQALILNAKMPEDIAISVKDFFVKLDTKYVAVRSSATAEDSASAAWAGQLDSFLNTTEETLLTNVQRCWASLFTPRAIFYRFEKELHKQKISVAVVVQKMVESEYSGIAFSVHPVTQDRNQLIIEAGFGLGEAIVSGSVTPDSYVVKKNPREIIDINVSTQTRALHRIDGGGNEWSDIQEPQASSQVLNEKQILELSEIILRIENHYGFPCDIEWAFENGIFYITQSRPITTMSCDENVVYDKSKQDFIELIEKKKWVPVVERRCCVFVRHLLLNGGMSDVYNEALGCVIQPIGDAILRDQVFYPVESIENTKDALQTLVDKFGYQRLMEISNACISRAEELQKYMNSDTSSLEDRLESFKKMYSKSASYVFIVVFSEKLLEKRVEDLIREKTSVKFDYYFESLIYPKKYNENTEELIALLQLTKYLKENDIDINSDVTTKLFNDHAAKFGWLGTRWMLENVWNSDDIKLRVSHYLNKDIDNELNNLLKPRNDANLVSEEFIRTYNLNKKEIDLIDLVKEFVFLRTFRTESLAKAHSLVKPLLKRAAEKLIIDVNDIPFLTVDEILDSLKNGQRYDEIIHSRKKGWYMILSYNEIRIFADKERKVIDDLSVFKANAISDTKISGQIAWKGVVKGRVVIVKDQKDLVKVQDGDILVTVMTFPNYIPAMEKTAAFITDEGGILCHAAIIAREMKKPCIIGTKIATKVLRDGDFVEVDADSGAVTITKKA